MGKLELKIVPPIQFVVCSLCMWAVAQVTPSANIVFELKLILVLLFSSIAIVFGLLGIFAFRRAQTTVSPVKPEDASVLVTAGVYRITRNPMYVGLVFLLLAWSVYLSNVYSLLCLPAFIGYLSRFQIVPEERALLLIFGEEYSVYKDRVRRWL